MNGRKGFYGGYLHEIGAIDFYFDSMSAYNCLLCVQSVFMVRLVNELAHVEHPKWPMGLVHR